jgi:hypothetical protein
VFTRRQASEHLVQFGTIRRFAENQPIDADGGVGSEYR